MKIIFGDLLRVSVPDNRGARAIEDGRQSGVEGGDCLQLRGEAVSDV